MVTQTMIPRARGLPLVGNLREYRRDPLAFLLRLGREHGDICQFQVGPWSMILLNSSEYAHAVLVERADEVEKSAYFRLLGRLALGDGLLTSTRDIHRRQRKLVAPAFQHRRLAAYAGVVVSNALHFQEGWADGEIVDVNRDMLRLTLRIVGKILFDSEVLDEADDLADAMVTAMRYIDAQFTALVHLPLSWPTPQNRRFRQALARLDATIYRMVDDRRRTGEDRGDLLSMLLQSRDEADGGRMSDAQVRDEAMTLFAAGHETTSNALVWTWYLLAQHPEIYRRVRAEVDGVLAGRAPTFADLAALPYTLQVVKEAMRLYPPAWVFSREALRPIDLRGYQIPGGAMLLLSPYTIHRRPDYFPDPERFDPDRFTPEAEQRRPRYAYMPFGGGPRICIGNHLALMELHLIVAALSQRVEFELVAGQRVTLEPLITLRPKGGLRLRVRRRGGIPSSSLRPAPAPDRG